MRQAALAFVVAFSLAQIRPMPAQQTAQLGTVEMQVMQVDEAYRVAKLRNDTAAMGRILADDFYGMNQNGNGRNKTESIELWRTFPISSLTTDSFDVNVTGNTAVVNGTQTENGNEPMLFKRVYVKGQAGWQLFSSTQFRNPKLTPAPARPEPRQQPLPGGIAGVVMRLDEEYRVAKLKQDTNTLNRILADGFYEMNQNGNGRNKAETLDLWHSFSISSLTTDSYEVRVSGDMAAVTGTQTENGNERMLFTRIYVKGPTDWQLLSSIQFRDPKLESNM